jgi:hypothetical protein
MNAHGIGFQHGTFRSQSTQGTPWTGTASIVREALSIVVYPDYLDVQLDWEFQVGGNRPASYDNALEIVGNLSLEAHSVVSGLLLWNGDAILKAKLKTREQARSEYEKVVDRDSPAPPMPHDPVILEKVGTDNYNLSVFPVAWGGTRKMRLRYVIPKIGGRFNNPQAFSADASATIMRGPGVKSFALETTDDSLVAFEAPSVVLDKNRFEIQSYPSSLAKPRIRFIHPLLENAAMGSSVFFGDFTGFGISGRFTHVDFRLPAAIRNGAAVNAQGPFKIYATLKNREDSCRTPIPLTGSGDAPLAEARIFSDTPLEPEIKWSVYKDDVLALEYSETPELLKQGDGMQYARSFCALPFNSTSAKSPASWATALGFIDSKYALVALESDALPASEAGQYRDWGVPNLSAADIVADKDTTRTDTTTRTQKETQPQTETALSQSHGLPEGVGLQIRNGRLHIELGLAALESGKAVRISIHTLRGRTIRSWNRSDLSDGQIDWSPFEASLPAGVYLLEIKIGNRVHSHAVYLR